MADREKYFELLQPCQESLERFVLNLTRDREMAKDIVSETIIIAYDNFTSLKKEKAFLSYLFTIASRLCYAETKRNRRLTSTEETRIDMLFCTNIPPDDLLDYKFLYDALDKLDIKVKEAIILAELMGFSHKEIAEIQGTTVVSIKVRIHRGKKELAELMSEKKYPKNFKMQSKLSQIKNNNLSFIKEGESYGK